MNAKAYFPVAVFCLLLAGVSLHAQQAIYWKKDYLRDAGGGTVGTAAPTISGPLPPGHLMATATSTSAVAMVWDPPFVPEGQTAVDHYAVLRRTTGSYAWVADTSTPVYSDTGLSATTAYVYVVRACYSSGCSSGYADSTPDVATTVVFTDSTLTAGATAIKAAHISELRTAVDAVRTAAGSGAASWTDTSLSGVVAKAAHVSELRSNLASALSTLGVPAPTYTDSTLTAGSTVIKKAHIAELRQIVQ
jgi:hypothetical protein